MQTVKTLSQMKCHRECTIFITHIHNYVIGAMPVIFIEDLT